MNKIPTHKDKIVQETTLIKGDFPFNEVRSNHGDYFDNIVDCLSAGYEANQIWSVAITDDVGSTTITYGPPHHIVNVDGYVCTEEQHDHHTYYEDTILHEDYD